jgi:hypothetical protein
MKKLMALGAALVLAAGTAQAALIRVDFEATSGGWGSVSVSDGTVESRAVNADSVFASSGSNVWNILTVPSWNTMTLSPSYTGLKDTATGNATGVSMSFTGYLSSAAGGSGNNQDPSYDYFVLHESGTGGMPSVGYTISGLLPNTQVKLFLYSALLSNRGYDFSIGATTYTVASGSSTGLLVTGTTNGSGELSGTYTRTNSESNISGIQIYQIPEPASLGMLGVAAIAMLLRRKFRR